MLSVNELIWLQPAVLVERDERFPRVAGNHLPQRPEQLPTQNQQGQLRQGTVVVIVRLTPTGFKRSQMKTSVGLFRLRMLLGKLMISNGSLKRICVEKYFPKMKLSASVLARVGA